MYFVFGDYMPYNKNLARAKKEKNDEFYTQILDIENELKHYRNHFKNKIVFCNCGDDENTNFFRYFYLNFEFLCLKKLLCTAFKNKENSDSDENGLSSSYYLEVSKKNFFLPSYNEERQNYNWDETKIFRKPLKENGDFRSQECIDLLKQADIVVTNPPFSLFREYIAQLVEFNKKFLIMANINAVTYKDVFPLIKENKIWLGSGIGSSNIEFMVPDSYDLFGSSCRVDNNGKKFIKVSGVRWFTNLDIEKRHEDLILFRKYNPEDYPKYDNYDAINVNKTVDIPIDYDGVMGVPITFLDKYNPEQFKIIGELNNGSDNEYDFSKPKVNNKILFKRLLIRKIKKFSGVI